LTADDVPIDIVLHTPGGLALAAEQIAHAIGRRTSKVTVYVPHYAMSGGTLIALAADEIVMDPNAVLGSLDPQLGQHPAASIVHAVDWKIEHKLEIDDETLILADVARKATVQLRECVRAVLSGRLAPEKAEELASIFTRGEWTHDHPLDVETLRRIGLPINTDMPPEIEEYMRLFPQSPTGRPSVQYVPLPYRSPVPPRPTPLPRTRGG
jgi:ClpP class serine protease